MIQYKKGSLFNDDAVAFVNAVNTVGVMGAGIALQFKNQFPDMFSQYQKDCHAGKVQLGHMHVYETSLTSPRYIINFPTLKHWQDLATLADIEQGLVDLVQVVKKYNINTIAIPPLGSGLGGLQWADVKQLIENAFADERVTVHLYEPI